MSDHKLAEALRDAQEQPFEDWWEREGQFARSGGGQYEKTFAWNAWCAAIAAHEAEQQAGEAVARVRATSVTPGRFDEIDVLRPLPQGEYLLFAHPQQPLTEEQIRLERKRIDPMAEDMDAWSFEQGVRFAERALGITKDTK